jgi:DNA (cytosine-5)-methyltransferase 1
VSAYYNEHDPGAAAWLRELIKQGHIADGVVDERSIEDVLPSELAGFTQCHFFAGIGGWSYALRLAGWPDDKPVWTGSCPCQPFSVAGKGKGTADERHLWPAFAWLIRQCRPSVVFGEQVASRAGRGWLAGVRTDLEAMGYAVGAADLCAAGVGAPHIRQRLFWVGNADRAGRKAFNTQPIGTETGSSELATAGSFGWRRVSFAADCLGGDPGELGDECSICGLDYSNDCECPGPTQDDEYEYTELDGILLARRLGHAIDEGLEGYAGHGDDGHEPGWLDTDQDRPVAEAGGDSWSNSVWIPCADGKSRRIVARLALLPDGIPHTMASLRSTQGEVNAEATVTRPDEALQILRHEDGAEAVRSRAGRSPDLHASDVLQPCVHGSVDGGTDQGSNPKEQPSPVGQGESSGVREVRINEAAPSAPQRREPAKQRPLEFGDVVRYLPHAYSLAILEGDDATAQGLLRVYEACPSLGSVQHALQSVPSLRRSACGQEVQRAWDAGLFEGFGIMACNPLTKAFPSRSVALKGLGNAIVPQVAAAFIEACGL